MREVCDIRLQNWLAYKESHCRILHKPLSFGPTLVTVHATAEASRLVCMLIKHVTYPVGFEVKGWPIRRAFDANCSSTTYANHSRWHHMIDWAIDID